VSVKALETIYKGYRFRSRTEARWAVFFDAIGLRYQYEKEGFDLHCGKYLPDFYLPDIEYWFEVKGQNPTADEISKCSFLFWETNYPVLMASGPPSPEPQLLHVPLIMTDEEKSDGIGSVYPRYFFADDRKNEREFWLIDDAAEIFWWLGPENGPDHGKHPLVHSATKRAYEASRAARFGT
jgi:hypothetical protein